MPQFYWADDTCRSLSSAQGAFSISIDQLAHMVSQLHADALDHMRTKLLYGFDLRVFDRILSKPLVDDLHCEDAGFSFLTHQLTISIRSVRLSSVSSLLIAGAISSLLFFMMESLFETKTPVFPIRKPTMSFMNISLFSPIGPVDSRSEGRRRDP